MSRMAMAATMTSNALENDIERPRIPSKDQIIDFADERPSKRVKLQGRAFYESIGSPKWVVAPMVDQSEYAWRLLTRSYMAPSERGSVLAYSPMLHSRLFATTEHYRNSSFQAIRPPSRSRSTPRPSELTSSSLDPHQPELYKDGNPSNDRPLFVQFCANDPNTLLSAAQHVAPYCDAVDLNLGCPQGIAKKGHYGAFLQEDWPLIHSLINILHKNLDIPVTAKFRIQENKEKTLEYAKMILGAGAQIITVHGRRRDQKGHNTGVADWSYIKYLRDNLPPDTVIFANGNILEKGDLQRCLEATGADAVMSAEGNLHNPAVFADEPTLEHELDDYWKGRDGMKGGFRIDAVMRRYFDIIYTHVLERDPPVRKPLFTERDVVHEEKEVMDGGSGGDAKAEIQADTELDADGRTTSSNGLMTSMAGDTKVNSKRSLDEDNDANEAHEEPDEKKQKLSKKQRKKQARELAKAEAKARRQTEVEATAAGQSTNTSSATNNENGPRRLTKAEQAAASSDPNLSAMQAHLFSLLRVFVSVPDDRHRRIRDALSRCRSGDMDAYEGVLTLVEERVKEGIIEYARDTTSSGQAHNRDGNMGIEEEELKMKHGNQETNTDDNKNGDALSNPANEEISSAETIARVKRPWWICQSFVRPLPSEAFEKGAMRLSKKEQEKLAGKNPSASAPASVALAAKEEESKGRVVEVVVCDDNTTVNAGYDSVGVTWTGNGEDANSAEKGMKNDSCPEKVEIARDGLVCG